MAQEIERLELLCQQQQLPTDLPTQGSGISAILVEDKTPQKLFPKEVAKKLFPKEDSQKSSPEEVPQKSFPKEDFKQLFPKEVPQKSFPKEELQKSFPKNVPQKSFPEEEPQKSFPEDVPQKSFPEEDFEQLFPEDVPQKSFPEPRELFPDAENMPPQQRENLGSMQDDDMRHETPFRERNLSEIPDRCDHRAPRPSKGEHTLSAEAIRSRAKRIFTPRANGTLKVSRQIYEEWNRRGSKERKNLEAIFRQCGYAPEI